jgi:hypothetical protein
MNYLNGGRWALVDEFTEVESGKRNDRPEPRIAPNRTVAHNVAIKCENPDCHFTRDRDLPILVVDEPIYRRLPAFLIATVDKFAALPWVGSSGAFFGHVDRVLPPRMGRVLGGVHGGLRPTSLRENRAYSQKNF